MDIESTVTALMRAAEKLPSSNGNLREAIEKIVEDYAEREGINVAQKAADVLFGYASVINGRTLIPPSHYDGAKLRTREWLGRLCQEEGMREKKSLQHGGSDLHDAYSRSPG